MKITGIMSFAFLVTVITNVSGIFEYSIQKIEGGTQSLSAFQGKRMLIVTLPINQTAAADSFLYSLDTLATAHATNLKVIGVPSYEDGYTAGQKAQLEQWYRTKLGAGIILTEGMYTRKTSASLQDPLFKWLTTDTMNESFDMDVNGPNYKFFIKEDGELYGVIESQTKVSSAAVNKTLNLQ